MKTKSKQSQNKKKSFSQKGGNASTTTPSIVVGGKQSEILASTQNTMSWILILLVGIVAAGFYYMVTMTSGSSSKKDESTNQMFLPTSLPVGGIMPPDVYGGGANIPPLRDERVYPNPTVDIRGAIPINIPTQSVDTSYRQMGILTRSSGGGDETILALMGRPLITNRDKWQFYTLNDKTNAIKLPVSYKGKSCTGEYGCDSLSNGDTIYVEGYKDAFQVTMYENGTMRYLPVI